MNHSPHRATRRNCEPFCTPFARARTTRRDTCSPANQRSSEAVPSATIMWHVRAQSVLLRMEQQLREVARAKAKPRESWRRRPVLPVPPNGLVMRGDPPPSTRSEPSVAEHDVKLPTATHLIYPWEGTTSNIEWAVINWLGKHHPDLYLELLEVASERCETNPCDPEDL